MGAESAESEVHAQARRLISQLDRQVPAMGEGQVGRGAAPPGRARRVKASWGGRSSTAARRMVQKKPGFWVTCGNLQEHAERQNYMRFQ